MRGIIEVWFMWILIGLIHWVRKEVCHQRRVTEETSWGYPPLKFIDLFDFSGLVRTASCQSKLRTRLSGSYFKLHTNLFLVLFRVVKFADNTFFWCLEYEKIVSLLWHCLCLLWCLWSLWRTNVSLSYPSARLTARRSRDKLLFSDHSFLPYHHKREN